MLNLGRVVIKTRGRDAGKVAVIVDIQDGKMVLIDGNVKRKQCNANHLEPLAQTFDIKKGASTEEIKKLLEEHNMLKKPKKAIAKKRDRKKGPRPRRVRKNKNNKAPTEKGKKAKKAPKKTEDEKVEAALAKV